MKRVSLLVLFCLAGSLLCEVCRGEDWPQWRGPKRDNISASTGINTDWEAKPPQLLWQMEGLGDGYSSVSIVGNRLYTVGNRDNAQCVMAVDLDKREVVWSTPVTNGEPDHGYKGSRCTPAIDGDRLYVVSSDGAISCLQTDNGSVVWSKNFDKEWQGRMHSGWGFSESPLVDGDHVLCTPGGDNAMIVCLNKKTGETVWTTAMPDPGGNGSAGAGYSSIMISKAGGVKQYVTLVGRGLIGVAAQDGKLLWTYNRVANGTANIPTPIVAGDYIFGSSGYGTGSCLIKITNDNGNFQANEVYFKSGDNLQNHHGGMILIGKHIYLGNGHGNGFPTCIDALTGEKTWGDKFRGPGGGSAATTAVAGHLIFRYEDGTVALIEANPAKYILKGKFMPVVKERESWAHPVVVDKKLYLREQNHLMVYDLAK
ncbi:MAG: PQQ-binding-like beta-propeller repeat protein [Pirellulales bacterium]|nr:PQQ-binding-like beta-propeller repeat protein [Pirellulales bacterium]